MNSTPSNPFSTPSNPFSTPAHRLPIWLQERFANAYKDILRDEVQLEMNNEAIRLNQETLEEGAPISVSLLCPYLDTTDKTFRKVVEADDCSIAWGLVTINQPLNGDNAEEFASTMISYILTKAREYSLFGVDVEDYVRGINLAMMIEPKNAPKFKTTEELEAALAGMHAVDDAIDELEHWLAITDGQSIFGRYLKAYPEAEENGFVDIKANPEAGGTYEEIRLGFALAE